MAKKVGFFGVWLATLVLGVYTVYSAVPFAIVKVNHQLLINFYLRIAGVLAFTMLFWQIVLGAFMQTWMEKLGSWVFMFHQLEGMLAYALVLVHPLLFLYLTYTRIGKIDPFYVFTDVCALCSKKTELYYSFGRYAFWLVSLGVFAARFKSIDDWLKKNWRKLHILNYFAFFLVAIHAKLGGTDAGRAPFVWFYWAAVAVVSFIAVKKLARLFSSS
jgi:predicted ferric reductase